MTTYNNPIDYFKATAGYFDLLDPTETGNNGYRKVYSIMGSTAVPKQWQIDEESLLISPELMQQFNKPLSCVCEPLGYMGEICNEGGLESFYYQIIILPLARALEGIGSDIRIYARLPISGQPLNKDSTQATTNFTPDGTICRRDKQPYMVFDYKYAFNTTPLDPVDGDSFLSNSYVGQMIYYCISGGISDAMILKEDALIFLHITGPQNDESTLSVLSDTLSDVDPFALLQDAKRPWTAGSSTPPNLPQRKRIAFDPQESPDHLANSSPIQATNRGPIVMAARTRNPPIDSDPLARAASSSPPKPPGQGIPYSSPSYRPSSSGSQRLEGFGSHYTYYYKSISIDDSSKWLAFIFSYAISVKKMHEKGQGSINVEMIDPFKS